MEYKSREECLEQVILLYQEKEELNKEIKDLKEKGNSLRKLIDELEDELEVAKKSKIVYVPYSQTPAWPQYPQNPIYPQGPIYNTPIITCDGSNIKEQNFNSNPIKNYMEGTYDG